jgi:hypothetical protein
VKVEKKAVAEVCVGAKKARLNVRAKAQVPKGLKLSGKSKSWPEGGVVATESNLAAARALLTSLTSAPPVPALAPVPAKVTPKTTSARKPRSRKAAAAA